MMITVIYDKRHTTLKYEKQKNKKQRLKFPTTHARIYVKKYYKAKNSEKKRQKKSDK